MAEQQRNPVVSSLDGSPHRGVRNVQHHPITSVAASPDRSLAVVAEKDTLRLLSIDPSGITELRSFVVAQRFQQTPTTVHQGASSTKSASSRLYGDVRETFNLGGTSKQAPPPHSNVASTMNIIINDIGWSSPTTAASTSPRAPRDNLEEATINPPQNSAGPLQQQQQQQQPSGSDDLSMIAAAGSNGVVVIWDADEFRTAPSTSSLGPPPQAVLNQHSRAVNRLAWHPRNASLLTASQDGTVRLWERRFLKDEHQQVAPTSQNPSQSSPGNLASWFRAATLSEPSNSFSKKNQRRSYSWYSREIFQSRSEKVRDIKWSPFLEDVFAMALDGGTLLIYNIHVLTRPWVRIAAHDREVSSIDWHPTLPYWIATGGASDRKVKIWDLESRMSLVLREVNDGVLAGHDQTAKSNSSSDSNSDGRNSSLSSKGSSPTFNNSTFNNSTWNSRSGSVGGSGSGSGSVGGANKPLHILSVGASVTCVKWRPPTSVMGGEGSSMLAIATAPAKGASAGGNGLICLFSHHRPFMPLSVVEGHKDGAVTDFCWLDTPAAVGLSSSPDLGNSRQTPLLHSVEGISPAQPTGTTVAQYPYSPNLDPRRRMMGLASSSEGNTTSMASIPDISSRMNSSYHRPRSGSLKSSRYAPPFRRFSMENASGEGYINNRSSNEMSALEGTAGAAYQKYNKQGQEQLSSVDALSHGSQYLQQQKGQKQQQKLQRQTADGNYGIWQHVLSVGRDGQCIIQSFPRGNRPLSRVSPSCFAMTNLSPFQRGYGSLQIFSVHQEIPSPWDVRLTALRQDLVTANTAFGVFREVPPGLVPPKGKEPAIVADQRLPALPPQLVFNVVDQGNLNEDERPVNMTDHRPYKTDGITEGVPNRTRIMVAPEVVHLSRFADLYKSYPDSECPTRVDICLHNAEIAEELQGATASRMWTTIASLLEGAGVDVLSSPSSAIPRNALHFALMPTVKALLEDLANAGNVQTCVILCEILQVIDGESGDISAGGETHTTIAATSRRETGGGNNKRGGPGSSTAGAPDDDEDIDHVSTRIPGLEIQLVREWYLAYIDLLQRMCLFSHASNLIRRCNDPVIIGKLNQQSTTIQESCPHCRKPLDPKKQHGGGAARACPSCRRRIGLCFLCHEPVQGLFVWCPGCGHGGHLHHAIDWFGASSPAFQPPSNNAASITPTAGDNDESNQSNSQVDDGGVVFRATGKSRKKAMVRELCPTGCGHKCNLVHYPSSFPWTDRSSSPQLK